MVGPSAVARNAFWVVTWAVAALLSLPTAVLVVLLIAVGFQEPIAHLVFSLPFIVSAAIGWVACKRPILDVLFLIAGAAIVLAGGFILLPELFIVGLPLFGLGLGKALRLRVLPALFRLSAHRAKGLGPPSSPTSHPNP